MKHTPYSHSKISTFYSCPHKFDLQYIKKIKVVDDSLALRKGNYIHKVLENWPNKIRARYGLPEELIKEYDLIVDKFINSNLGKKCLLEENLIGKEINFALDKKIKISDFNDKDLTLLRGKIDSLFKIDQETLYAIDYKTGKFRENQKDDQLKLYSSWIFISYPEVQRVESSFIFVEHDKEIKSVFERKDLNKIVFYFLNKIKRIEKEKFFAKNITYLCNYCPFFKSGDCKI